MPRPLYVELYVPLTGCGQNRDGVRDRRWGHQCRSPGRCRANSAPADGPALGLLSLLEVSSILPRGATIIDTNTRDWVIG
jgi:hypothetical protein